MTAATNGSACRRPGCDGVLEYGGCNVCGQVAWATPDTRARHTGHQSATHRVPGEWSALVRADRSWFDEVCRRGGPDAAILKFPPYCPQRRFTLSGTRLAIGRGSRSWGIEPDIDLSGPPLDPGVSALHALLLARPDGGWELVDLDSTTGTTVGDTTDPIAPNTAVTLAHGDRIKLGAWTTITIMFAATTHPDAAHAGPL
jgi:FHA domain